MVHQNQQGTVRLFPGALHRALVPWKRLYLVARPALSVVQHEEPSVRQHDLALVEPGALHLHERVCEGVYALTALHVRGDRIMELVPPLPHVDAPHLATFVPASSDTRADRE